MSRTSFRRFSYLEYEIEIIRERRNIPVVLKLEPRLGIEVRYGLKFNGQITDWSDFVEAAHDEASANNLAEMGVRRARTLRKKEGFNSASSAA